jgi:TolB-like protein
LKNIIERGLMRKIICYILVICTLAVSAEQQDKKLKIAILTLKNTNGVSEGETELISDRLRNEFFSTGMVDVMEREQMQEVLKEQGFQQSGLTCAEQGCMVEIGRMLGVQRLITGSIGKLGSMFMVNVRSVNVETGKMEKVVSEDVKGEIEDVVKIIPEIARKIAGGQVASSSKVIAENKAPPVEASREPQDDLPCNGSYYMERLKLDKSVIGFVLDPDKKEELEEDLADALEEALDRKVIPATKSQLASSKCNTKVIKIHLNSYRKSPDILNQYRGTANITLSIFNSPSASSPLVAVNIERTGDRHWHDETPFLNAFDEIIKTIEDDLWSKVRRYFK